MKRIKLVLAVGVVIAALLALNAGSALADDKRVFFDDDIYDSEVESVELESDGEWYIELENGDDIETYDYDLLEDLVDDDDDYDFLDDLVDDDEHVRVIDLD